MQIYCICDTLCSMKNDVKKILKSNALKITKERELLLDILIDSKEPLSIDEIKKNVKDKMNTTTIYRTLDRFADLGLVYKTHFGSGKAFYEFQKKHHHHITCTKCGAQEAIDVCVSSLKIQKTKMKNFSGINNHVLEFFGLCRKCA